ncbi:hypothetical protein [Synechococcus phage BUCT-ZZ01]|nr:hypothetical protein [Synechococcus phage BUCT-ZZ01]
MKKLETPIYNLTLLASDKKIKYRPFLVKEERSLMLALESKNFDDILLSIEEICRACTFDEVDIEELPYFDLEYLFINIRAKSVSEEIDLIGKCECSEEATTEFTVLTNDIKLENYSKERSIIKIPDSDMVLKMRYPSVSEMGILQSTDAQDSKSVDEAAAVIAGCIEKSWSSEEEFNDSTLQEKIDWVDSITKKQYAPIKQFFQNMPALRLNSKYTCQHCGKEHNVELTGLETFFA